MAQADSSDHLTWHCLCSQLLLATTRPLHELPTREIDGSHIAVLERVGGEAKIFEDSIVTATNPTVLRLDDGFEKRYFMTCGRCGLLVGYYLDGRHFGDAPQLAGLQDDAAYFLPDSLVSTETLKQQTDGSSAGAQAKASASA